MIKPNDVDNKLLYNGFYLYNFNNKNTAFLSRKALFDQLISDKNIQNPDVRYYFHDHVFSKQYWLFEPMETLEELYLKRALQLRETYDYLILMYSGGTDSHQILQTFIRNNIFIDEIQTVNWESLLKGVHESDIDNHPELLDVMEYQRNAKHQLQKVSIESPKTKITVIDGSQFVYDDIIKRKFEIFDYNDNDTLKLPLSNKKMNIVKPYKKLILKHNHNNPRKEKTCLISGVEKPRIKIYGKQAITFRFYDYYLLDMRFFEQKLIEPWFNIEWFFWSPAAPLIPIKQCHVLKKQIERDYSLYDKIKNHSFRSIERDIAKHIYPYRTDFFLADKSAQNVVSSEVAVITKILKHEKQEIVDDVVKEIGQFNDKRYHENMFNNRIASRIYDLGYLRPKWDRELININKTNE